MDGLATPAVVVTESLALVASNHAWDEDATLSDMVLDQPEIVDAIARVRDGGSRAHRTRLSVDGTMIEVSVGLFHADPQLMQVVLLTESHSERGPRFDRLTGMLLGSGLREELETRLHAPSSAVALLMVQLDGFLPVNAVLGRSVGNTLVGAAAARMRSLALPTDLMFRFGPDQFAIVLADPDCGMAIRTARWLVASLGEPFDLECRQVRSGARVGIATGCQGDDAELLIWKANLALQAAHNRETRWSMYDDPMHAMISERLTLEQELRTALSNSQLRVHYQPQVELATGVVVGLEALVRWAHPTRGLLTPGTFLPAATEFGLLQDLDTWVLYESCRTVAKLRRSTAAAADLTIAVNVAATELTGPEGTERILAALQDTGLPAHALVVELTEDSLLGDLEPVVHALGRLRAHGVRIAIDDVGSGYSSLATLSRLPVDTLKIDRTFVNQMVIDPTSKTIVDAIIAIAHTLQARTVAEGVETLDELDAVSRAGADIVQGHVFAPALELQALKALLRSGHPVTQAIAASY